MPKIEVDVKEIERNYDSAQGNAKLGGWATLVLIISMLISFFSGGGDGSLFTVGFLVLGGFVFMWGYNKYQAGVSLKKLDQWSYLHFHKSYHDSHMDRLP